MAFFIPGYPYIETLYFRRVCIVGVGLKHSCRLCDGVGSQVSCEQLEMIQLNVVGENKVVRCKFPTA